MVNFVNFARIASICVGFHFGTMHGYFFNQEVWPNLNFLLEYQIKRVLIIQTASFLYMERPSVRTNRSFFGKLQV